MKISHMKHYHYSINYLDFYHHFCYFPGCFSRIAISNMVKCHLKINHENWLTSNTTKWKEIFKKFSTRSMKILIRPLMRYYKWLICLGLHVSECWQKRKWISIKFLPHLLALRICATIWRNRFKITSTFFPKSWPEISK